MEDYSSAICLKSEEVDVAVGEITITVARSKEVDFTIPYCETSAGFMVNIPRQLSKWASLLRYICNFSFLFQ